MKEYWKLSVFLVTEMAGEQINIGCFILPDAKMVMAVPIHILFAHEVCQICSRIYGIILLQVTSTTQKLLRRQLTVTAGYILETLDITTRMNISTLLTELKN